MEQFISQLRQAISLQDEQVSRAVAQLLDEAVPAALKASFLTALARKGESADEIFAFARELRAQAIQPPLDPDTRAGLILDVVGTGGDRLNTFNISTTVAIVLAAAGVAVAKHGNRAITSQAGSADVLEALGIPIDLTPAEAARSLREHRFCFLFAPHYHPAFKRVAEARKLCAAQGQRTIFNLLGPLLNPARPSAELAGIARADYCEPLARALQALGVQRGLVVCGQAGRSADGRTALEIDEFSILGPNTIAEFYHPMGFNTSVLAVDQFPIQAATLEDLRGGDRFANAEIVRRILRGAERGPKRDAVLLNAAAALLVAGKATSLTDGWAMAAACIDSQAAWKKLADLTAAPA